MEENQDNKSRRIIYVDASFDHETKKAKISLYDKEENKLDTLLIKKATNNSEAEKYAILYACLYIKKKGITGRKIHILNDNYTATQDEQILKICQYFNVGLSWIPREINEVADKGSKLEVNVKEKESNLLELFYDILINQPFQKKSESEQKQKVEPKTDKDKTILLNAVKLLTSKDKSLSIGEVGTYIKKQHPTIQYSSLKKELQKYPDTFIVNDNNVKLK